MAAIRVVVKGKNLEVTQALRNYAEKKVAKLAKFLSSHHEASAEVMLRTERGIHIAEVTLSVAGLILRGEGKTPDMYTSIDSCVERIERQFNKYKTRIQRRLQGPKIGELAPADYEVDEGQALEPQIVRIKRFPVKPMDVEEAIMQMELLGHDFYVFVNSSTEEANVVYKRRDGNYGIIEPEY
jgi:putative sigma-54 modulation protein